MVEIGCRVLRQVVLTVDGAGKGLVTGSPQPLELLETLLGEQVYCRRPVGGLPVAGGGDVPSCRCCDCGSCAFPTRAASRI